MDDAHWYQLKELFFAALDVPGPVRAAWMEQIPDEELRAGLAQLLADDASASSLLDASHEALAGLIMPDQEPEHAVRQIGPYRILGELGHGGMGTVYLAARTEGGFQQSVALKVIRRDVGTGNIERRFELERQILATLTHENIARLLDGGTNEKGLPYFVMECIDGEPITRYCDGHRLSVGQRLRLFQEVCEAVHYAHQNLVVHRDLKPSNILVTKDGRPKLLDFGIAKLLGGDQPDPLFTQAGVRVFTPAYASPEQLCGTSISTASDVYALGIILYELLTGRRPYAIPPDEDAGSFVKTVVPKRPSDNVTNRRASAARSTTTDRLRRRLSGDLDTILLKALRKEPARRYASAEAFREDISRHLDGLPVRARKDTLAYRASKFAQRHKVWITAGVLILGSLVGGLGAALWQAGRATQEAAKAEAVKDFVMSLFEVADPNISLGETITAHELLDVGAMRIKTELADQPDVQAEMMTVVGDVYRKLGLYEAAQPLLEQALAMRRELLGAEHRDVAASLHNLAVLLQKAGDYAAADSLYRATLAMQIKLLGRRNAAVATTMNNMAALHYDKGDYDRSEHLFRDVLAMRRQLFGEEHPDVAMTLNDLGQVLLAKGDYDASEPLFNKALAMQRNVLNPEHTDLTMTLNNLALVLRNKGDNDAAEPLLREALTMKQKLLGDEHPSVAITLNNLALLLRRKGNNDDAELLYRQALGIWRKRVGDVHPQVATVLNNLAVLLREKGDYAAAEPLFREALAMKRTLLGEEHPSVAATLSGLALLAHRTGDYAAADSFYREALSMRRKLLGPEHPRVATILNRLATVSAEQGRYAVADSLFRETLAMQRKLFNPEHPELATTLAGFGEMVLARGQPESAEPLLREALKIRQAALPDGHWRRAHSQSALGACLSALNHVEEAETLLLEGYHGLNEERGQKDILTQGALRHLVAHYERQGMPKQAALYGAQLLEH